MQNAFLLLFLGGFLNPQLTVAESTTQAAPAAKKSQYPRITEVLGTVEDIKPTGKIAVSQKTLIVDRLNIVVKSGASVKIQLDEKRTLRAFSGTEFEIPSISWETRQFSEIKLKRGALRFEIESQPFKFRVKSPLFEMEPPVGESVLAVDPEKALAEAFMFKGEMEFRALNAEESVKLSAGQKVSFSGLLEEGEISYDLLLQGKKIPKGRLGSVETMTVSDAKLYSLESEKKAHAERLKKEHLERKKKQQFESQYLCFKPTGQLNDCLWKKQGADCLRLRCVADGKWKDSQKVDTSLCQPTPKIKPCDY